MKISIIAVVHPARLLSCLLIIATVSLPLYAKAQNLKPVPLDDNYNTQEDAILTVNAPGVLSNDIDPESAALTAVIYTQPLHGTVTLNSDGSFTYVPAADYNGTDVFVYSACDDQAECDTASVTIQVAAVNDVPIATNDNYTTPEDTPLIVPAPGALANDTDADNDALTAVQLSGPVNGTGSLNPDGSFTYTPLPDFSGADSIAYRIYDGQGDSADAMIHIAVTAVNDNPVGTNDSYTTTEDITLTVAAPGVLINDIDPEGNALTADGVVDPAVHGTLTLSSNGAFVYTPLPDYSGSDSATYRLKDSNGGADTVKVFFTITPVNDKPVAVDDSYTTPEDVVLTVAVPGVQANDMDADGDLLSSGLVAQATHGEVSLGANGSFSYSPNINYTGTDSFAYRVIDNNGSADTAVVNLVITPVNDPPVAINDFYAVFEDKVVNIPAPGILRNDKDVEGDSLILTLLTQPALGTLSLSPDGSFTYTPQPDSSGEEIFTYRICDDTLSVSCSTAKVKITIIPVNDKPVANDDTVSTTRNTPLVITAPGVLVNDFHPDGDMLSAAVIGAPLHGTFLLNADGSFTYTPALNYVGADSVYYQACDTESLCDTAMVYITVNPGGVNNPPVAGNDSLTISEDTPVVINRTLLSANDSDPDGDNLTLSLVTNPVNGQLASNPDLTFTYTPNFNYNGNDSFTYRVCDPDGLCDTALVKIRIIPVNDRPVAQDDSYTTDRNVVLNVPAPGVLVNDADIEGSNLTPTLIGNARNGTIVLNSDRSLRYTPNNNYAGLDSARYRVCDPQGLCDTAMIRITVNSQNRPPQPQDDAYTTPVNVPVSGNVLANDSDPDGDPLTAVIVTSSLNGAVVLNPNGDFTFTPNSNYVGVDVFSYNACDNGSPQLCVTKNVTITVVGSPGLGVAKSATTPVRLPDGTYNVTYTITVKNTGTVNLSSVQVTDDLKLTFPSPISFRIIGISTATEGLAFNTAYNGNTDINLLLGTSTLALNRTGVITFTVNLTLNGQSGQFLNSATATGRNGTNVTTDVSQSGTNPDPDGNNNPGDNSEPTAVSFAAPLPVAGIAKTVSQPKRELNGSYTFTYTITVKNYGTVALQNVNVTDNLLNTFPAPVHFQLTGIPKTTGSLIANPQFDGRGNTSLLRPGSLLSTGQTSTITFTVNVQPGRQEATFSNTATVTATAAGIDVSDVSVNGLNPDVDGNGQPDEQSVTPVTLQPSTAFVPGGFSPDGDGTNDVFVIENVGGRQVSLEMYNRWGALVFKDSNYQNDWRGVSDSGNDLPDGTYYYVISLDNGQETLTGYITLNR